MPLEANAGATVADMIVSGRMNWCVLDVSDFSKGDKIRFLIAFAERLYRKNDRPLHLFLEEADDYAPQKPFRDEARMLGAWENIVRRGRGRGLGMTMITQRSAAINKNVLTQIETLIVMRTTSPQDRKAIGDWLKHQGGSEELLASLPKMKSGEAWIWSPSWLEMFQKVTFPLRKTFDSGATPKMRKAIRPQKVADVDLDAIQEEMAATIERAKEDDPRELRKRIKELEKSTVNVIAPTDPEVERRLETALQDNDKLRAAISRYRDVIHKILKKVDDNLKEGREAVMNVADHIPYLPPAVITTSVPATRPRRAPGGLDGPWNGTPSPSNLSRPRGRILDALAWLDMLGIDRPGRRQVAFLAGMSPKSGSYANHLSAMRTDGFIDYPGTGSVTLTQQGHGVAHRPAKPPTNEELQDLICAKVSGPQERILRLLISAHPRAISRPALAEKAGLSPTSGSYANHLSALRTLGLLDYPSTGEAKATDVMFLGSNGQ